MGTQYAEFLERNPGETVLTPFMGVGSEVFGAVELGRRGVGVELKPGYFRQAVANLAAVGNPTNVTPDMFADVDPIDELTEGVA